MKSGARLFNPSKVRLYSSKVHYRMQRFLKTIETLSCWYSLESSHRVLPDEAPEFQYFIHLVLHHFVMAKLANSSQRVNHVLRSGHGDKSYIQYVALTHTLTHISRPLIGMPFSISSSLMSIAFSLHALTIRNAEATLAQGTRIQRFLKTI